MKISISNGVDAPTVLCDGPGRGMDKSTGPANLHVTGQVDTQKAKRLRALAVKVFERKNRETTISFDVSRECANVAAAERFAVEHQAVVLRSNFLIFDSAGGAIMHLRDAVLDTVDCTQVGVTVKVSYHAVGGLLEVL